MNYDDLDRLWNDSRREIFRLETLPVYTVPEEEKALAAFLRGEGLPVRTPDTSPWIRRLADTVAAGVRLYRVHIADSPSPTTSATSWRPTRVARPPGWRSTSPTAIATPTWPGDEDFWMFDEEHVAVMTYDPEGRPLGPVPGEDVARYVAWRDLAMARAVPLDAWLRENADRLSA